MSSFVGVGVSSVINAVSFSAASWLFKRLEGNEYVVEAERHNKAMEELSKAKEAFYENEIRKKDKIAQLRQEIADANNDMAAANKALDLLAKVRRITYNNKTFTKEPTLSDFYKPSEKMKQYQKIVLGTAGLGGGYLLARMIL